MIIKVLTSTTKTNRHHVRPKKTYNSGYSLVVTHLTTNPPVRCLNRAERTGSLVVSCPIVTVAPKCTVSGFMHSVNGYLAHYSETALANHRRAAPLNALDKGRSIQG
jgi:hypothetical protein